MTVIDTTPTVPAPVALAREALDQAAMVDDDSTRGQLAQTITTLERAVQELLLAHTAPASTVTEYGVKAFSKHLGEHHVDACDDLESALSTLRVTQKRIDAWAHLVSRQVPAPGPVGEWRALSPDDAAVAFETAKAVAK